MCSRVRIVEAYVHQQGMRAIGTNAADGSGLVNLGTVDPVSGGEAGDKGKTEANNKNRTGKEADGEGMKARALLVRMECPPTLA